MDSQGTAQQAKTELQREPEEPGRSGCATKSQVSAATTISLYLEDPWINQTRGGVRSALQYMGKGWFNLDEQNYATYAQSKMFKMLNVMRFNMQDALRYLVEGSCRSYLEMLEETCEPCLSIAQDFAWGQDLKNSKFKNE